MLKGDIKQTTHTQKNGFNLNRSVVEHTTLLWADPGIQMLFWFVPWLGLSSQLILSTANYSCRWLRLYFTMHRILIHTNATKVSGGILYVLTIDWRPVLKYFSSKIDYYFIASKIHKAQAKTHFTVTLVFHVVLATFQNKLSLWTCMQIKLSSFACM